jgi:hypothetical protein
MINKKAKAKAEAKHVAQASPLPSPFAMEFGGVLDGHKVIELL